jgi:hypothetical protein
MDIDSADGVHDDTTSAMPAAAGQETVITFDLSGPILAGEPAARVAHVLPTDDVAALRERVAVLERVVSDAQAQLQSLAAAVAGAMSSAARVEAPRPMASERAAQAAAVSSVGPPRAAGRGACVAVAARPLDAPLSDRIPLAVVPSREPEPEPEPAPRAVEPKARGLRRMISVLKHDH